MRTAQPCPTSASHKVQLVLAACSHYDSAFPQGTAGNRCAIVCNTYITYSVLFKATNKNVKGALILGYRLLYLRSQSVPISRLFSRTQHFQQVPASDILPSIDNAFPLNTGWHMQCIAGNAKQRSPAKNVQFTSNVMSCKAYSSQ